MQRSERRILTTHTGSLIRPASLVDPAADRMACSSGGATESSQTELRDAVEEVVRKQVAIGIDVVNDGEFGKAGWATYILDRLNGFEVRKQQLKPLLWLGRDRERFAEFFAAEMPFAATGMPAEVCTGPITYKNEDAIRRDIDNLLHAMAVAKPLEAFVTVVAPASTAYNGIDEHYGSERDYIFAIAAALREEYLAVHRAGLVVQVDDAVLANMYDTLMEQSPQRYREWAELRVEALNYALRGIPEHRVRYHICFGSWHVPHCADAPLEAIIDLVLRVNAGAYSLEAANPRHEHEWRVWQNVRLPQDKILLPGVVTHHTTTVEHPRLVADRIVRFAQLVGRENVIASTDCGFAQSRNRPRVHPTVMWAKLEALVEGARIASRELF
jgi:5-methyltetrahydropteroyltriglutamate--homocysteine methyltransferase